MALEEVALVCFSLVTMVGVVCLAYMKSEERKENIRQQGITQRAMAKVGIDGTGATLPLGSNEWSWAVPIIQELLKIPAIQNMVADKVKTALLPKEG